MTEFTCASWLTWRPTVWPGERPVATSGVAMEACSTVTMTGCRRRYEVVLGRVGVRSLTCREEGGGSR